MKKTSSGFTIVELLIVIVVIAILATISIVAYNGIQNRANDSAVQSDLASFAKIMEMQKIDNNGTYPTTLTAAMNFKFTKNAYGVDQQNRNLNYCYNSANDSYVLSAYSKSGTMFKVQNGTTSTTAYFHGYAVCYQVGIPTSPGTNPSQTGRYTTRNPEWDTWTN